MDVQIKALKIFFSNYNKNLKIYRDENNEIVIDGDIIIFDNMYTHFPVKFHKLNGSLSWRGYIDGFKKGSLESLINFPDIVTGDVRIYKNANLKSLKYCPKIIGGHFQCNDCNISDISELPEEIGGSLVLSNNPLIDVSNLNNSHIKGDIYLLNTKVKDFNSIKLQNDSSLIITEHLTNDIF